MNVTIYRSLITIYVLAATAASTFAQGSLTPSGAPTPTMKSLDQVEPRIPIDSTHTPGNGSNTFTINSPGSYYLTGNVTGVSGKNGILISVSNVTIDLGGYTLFGASGSLTGITDGGVALMNIVIRNGIIREPFEAHVRSRSVHRQ
jgi:hypothetical protein